MKRTLVTVVGVAGLLGPFTAVWADVATFAASKDNTLYETEDGGLSNGAGRYFFAGRTNQGPDEDQRRAVIAFDVGAQIPPGSSIESVTLTLYMSRTEAGTRTVSARRLLADWGEGGSNAGGQEGSGDSSEPGDATWIHTFYPGDLWDSAGGDFAGGPPSASTAVGKEGFYTWSSDDMAADVEGWVDAPATNFGWILIGDESASKTAKRFNSREDNDTTRRPKLEVTFTPPQATGACCTDGGICQELTEDDCGNAGGSYLGDGTVCEPNPCDEPVGACCFEGGDCLVLEETDCGMQDGTYQGDGTTCDPNPCPQPEGACCFPDGTCQFLTEDDCGNAGGGYQGDDVPCNPCPQPEGACCFDDGTCNILTAADCAAQNGTYQGDDTTCDFDLCPLALEPFVDELPRPAVAQPVVGEPGGEATYDIEIQQFQQQLHRDLPPTTLWGYDGLFPGPTIEATTGLPVTVNWINDLRDENGDLRTDHLLPVDQCPHGADLLPRTVTHLHGGHVPESVDGYPEATFLPGDFVTYVYPNIQPPATIWYHDHALGITRLNVQLGMAAFYLIRDEFETALSLPSGEYEIAMAIQDRSFNADGSLRYPAAWQDHFFGKLVLVNGKVWPYLEVDNGKYRFRVLNGSNSRVYRLSLSNGVPFTQIGTDGGLLSSPVELTELLLTPGERADLVIDFENYQQGTEIVLLNSAPAPYPGDEGVGVLPNVMKFIVTGNQGDTDPIPNELREVEALPEDSADLEREFILRRESDPCTGTVWLINGLGWDDITEQMRLGDTEVWSFINRSGIVHPMHMHLVFFQVLDRQDFEVIDDEIVPVGERMPPLENETGWKDTVRADPRQITRVIAKFEDFEGLYPYHCHILEHEDHEMMRQFRTLPACPGDIDRNDVVDFADILAILGTWGPCDACPEDVNENGEVEFGDILVVLANWGPCP